MDSSRVVITGLGLVTPIGIGIEPFWRAAVSGKNGVEPLSSIDTTEYRTKTGGEVNDFSPGDFLSEELIGHMGRSSQFAVAAAAMAVDDAKLNLKALNAYRFGVSVGTTMGEPQILEQGVKAKYEHDSADAIPAHLPRQYPCGVIPAHLAKAFGAKGPNMIIPTACAAGNYAIGYAYDLMQLGRIDVAIVGGTDPFSSIAFTGFNRLLATTTDIVRPFDLNRKGMAVSEGAGILIVETLSHALSRKAPIYAEVLGYGLGCDAFKMTIPDPTGTGGILALRRALNNAGITPEQVDYLCAHGTGTKENDKSETLVSKEVFGERAYQIPMSSLKSMLGHTMGAASAIEACACALMIKRNTLLPTINYNDPDPDCDLDYVPNTAREVAIDIAVSNAYAFAGNTSALVIGRYKG
ncbi:MAG: beta-ketoacyl-[acyl-carrier-protein] synthase family protein [Chitinivibrionales bacterium]